MPLDPVVAKMMEAVRKSGRPQLSEGSPATARAVIAAGCAVFGKGPDVREVRAVTVPTREGSIAGRLYHPTQQANGLVIYLHGGGWVVGALDDFDALARTLAVRSGCALLLIDYRLAPDHSFPAGLHDAEDSLRWANANIADLAGRSVPLVIAGDSAGANLAIVAGLALRHEVKPALQVLFYPVTDTRMDTASYRSYGGTEYPLTAADMKWFLDHYLGGQPADDPRVAPLHEERLAESPRTWIATAEYDVLRDEGEAFAQRLEAAGVPVELRRYQGLAHGFARWMNLVDASSRALDDAAGAILYALGAGQTAAKGRAPLRGEN